VQAGEGLAELAARPGRVGGAGHHRGRVVGDVVEPADPCACCRTEAAGQSLPGLSAGRRPELDVMRGFVVAGPVVFHSAVAFASGASWFVTDPRPGRGFTVLLP
jgi:hypothetical protein